jgi:hypothetical protein
MNNGKLAGKLRSVWINNNNIFHILAKIFQKSSHRCIPCFAAVGQALLAQAVRNVVVQDVEEVERLPGPANLFRVAQLRQKPRLAGVVVLGQDLQLRVGQDALQLAVLELIYRISSGRNFRRKQYL